MSVKHVRDYYEQVTQQYQDMIESIKDFEDMAMEKIIEPERLEILKESIQPLLRNYELLSYIMYLLYKPNRGRKKKKYEQQYAKQIRKIPFESTKEGVIETNNEVIKNLKNMA